MRIPALAVAAVLAAAVLSPSAPARAQDAPPPDAPATGAPAEAPAADAPPAEAPADAAAPDAAPRAPGASTLGMKGFAGIGLAAGGAVALVGGAVALLLGSVVLTSDVDRDKEPTPYLLFGGGLTGVTLGPLLAAGGAALLLNDLSDGE